MGADLIVKRDIAAQIAPDMGNVIIGMQIHFLILDAAPEPLNEHIVTPASLTIHADPDTMLPEQSGKCLTGKLAALVGIENLRTTIFSYCILDRCQTEVRCQGIGYPE